MARGRQLRICLPRSDTLLQRLDDMENNNVLQLDVESPDVAVLASVWIGFASAICPDGLSYEGLTMVNHSSLINHYQPTSGY